MDDFCDVSFTPLAIAHSLVRKRATKMVDGCIHVANYFSSDGDNRFQKLVVVARAEDVSVNVHDLSSSRVALRCTNDLVVAQGKGFEYLSESIRTFLKVGTVFFVVDNTVLVHPYNEAISEFPFDHVLMEFGTIDHMHVADGICAATVHVRFI